MAILTRIVIGIFIFVCSLAAFADEKSLQLYEQKIKAGIVYNLLKYTQWPVDSTTIKNNKLSICLYSNDPFDGYLSPLAGRTLQQLTIDINIIDSIAKITNCSVVIVHKDQLKDLSQLLNAAQQKNILTVSDAINFAQTGGMVELAKQDEKISLYINPVAISAAHLSIQEPMLKLTKVITPLSAVQ